MRVSEKMALIDKIGRELQSRYSYQEIDAFLAEFDIDPPGAVNSNSKWVYSKAALTGIPDAVVLRVAAELDMPVAGATGIIQPPKNWKDTSHFKLFISHISKDKLKATRLKECLAPYKIAGFVAHEDITPTLEWQTEIERGLYTMDGFLAMHTVGFSQSFWCQQEVGFAVGRSIKVISLKMGEDPTGFIGKHQALPRRDRMAEDVAKEIDAILSDDPRTKDPLADAKAKSRTWDDSMSEDIPF
jgi:hypothetical protein